MCTFWADRFLDVLERENVLVLGRVGCVFVWPLGDWGSYNVELGTLDISGRVYFDGWDTHHLAIVP